ncbi:MAG: hypothetical protein U1E14_14720 [Geminicoccaceae bacterium]
MRAWPLAAATLVALHPLAAAAQGGWEAQLSAEILEAEHCDVAFIGEVVEREVDGRKVVMAKVTCTDRRSFDAFRDDEFVPFAFKECPESSGRSSC